MPFLMFSFKWWSQLSESGVLHTRHRNVRGSLVIDGGDDEAIEIAAIEGCSTAGEGDD